MTDAPETEERAQRPPQREVAKHKAARDKMLADQDRRSAVS